MKNVSPGTNAQAYKKFFTDVVKFRNTLVLWQVGPQGRRVVEGAEPQELGDEVLRLRAPGPELATGVLFAYSADRGAIFKCDLIDCRGEEWTLALPGELCFLDDDDVFRIKGVGVDLSQAPWRVKSAPRSARDSAIFDEQLASITLAEEDKLFADKREAPRARPKVDKIIGLRHFGKLGEEQSYKLFDLSRGGMGFLSYVDGAFKKGDIVQLTNMDGQELDDPIRGEVMSVRDLMPEQVGWKVGVKFVDA